MASDSLFEAVDEMLGVGCAACSQPAPSPAACKRKLPEGASTESDGMSPSKRRHCSEEAPGTAAATQQEEEPVVQAAAADAPAEDSLSETKEVLPELETAVLAEASTCTDGSATSKEALPAGSTEEVEASIIAALELPAEAAAATPSADGLSTQEPPLLAPLEAVQQPQPAASLASTANEGGAVVLELPAVVAASASADDTVEEVGTKEPLPQLLASVEPSQEPHPAASLNSAAEEGTALMAEPPSAVAAAASPDGSMSKGPCGLVMSSPEQLQPEISLIAADDGVAALEELPSFGERVQPAGSQGAIDCQPCPADPTQQEQEQQPSFSFPRHQPLRLVCSAPPAAAAAPPPDCSTDVIWDTFSFDESDTKQKLAPQAAQQMPFRMDIFQPGATASIGGYTLLDHKNALAVGGLGKVFKARHEESGVVVALKMANKEFNLHLGASDFTWSTFSAEWNAMRALDLGRSFDWMPTVYEAGLFRTDDGVVPWITMELLGPSLYDLGWAVPEKFAAFAHGMLDCLEALHARGFVHRDVKPANFTAQYGYDGTCAPKVYLIDFGFAEPWSEGMNPDAELSFCGTPDYASIRSLRSKMPGPSDDLEALGYTFLDLWRQRMPWDITKKPQKKEAKGLDPACILDAGRTRHGGANGAQPAAAASGAAGQQAGGDQQEAEEEDEEQGGGWHDASSSGWSEQELRAMAARKEREWARLVRDGHVPPFILHWVQYCQSVPAGVTPDYAGLHRFIDWGCGIGTASPAPAAATDSAAAAPAAKGEVAPAAALLAAEE